MENNSQEKIRRYALIGAVIGLVIGLGVGALGFWLSLSRTAEVSGMMLVSMSVPGCILIGAVIGIFLAQHAQQK